MHTSPLNVNSAAFNTAYPSNKDLSRSDSPIQGASQGAETLQTSSATANPEGTRTSAGFMKGLRRKLASKSNSSQGAATSKSATSNSATSKSTGWKSLHSKLFAPKASSTASAAPALPNYVIEMTLEKLHQAQLAVDEAEADVDLKSVKCEKIRLEWHRAVALVQIAELTPVRIFETSKQHKRKVAQASEHRKQLKERLNKAKDMVTSAEEKLAQRQKEEVNITASSANALAQIASLGKAYQEGALQRDVDRANSIVINHAMLLNLTKEVHTLNTEILELQKQAVELLVSKSDDTQRQQLAHERFINAQQQFLDGNEYLQEAQAQLQKLKEAHAKAQKNLQDFTAGTSSIA